MITAKEASGWIELVKRMSKEKKAALWWRAFVTIALMYNVFGTTHIGVILSSVNYLPRVIEIQNDNTKAVKELRDAIKEIRDILARHNIASDLNKSESATVNYEGQDDLETRATGSEVTTSQVTK